MSPQFPNHQKDELNELSQVLSKMDTAIEIFSQVKDLLLEISDIPVLNLNSCQ